IHCNYGANGISIDNYQFILNNNGGMPSVIYTDPKNDGGNNPTPPPKRVLSKEQQVAVDIRNVLSKEGYTIQAIAAICGNADVECGMRPDISEIGGGGGYGVVQWTSP
ncbi:UNVERIFIED_CONTAM: phage tail tip lysozyme, partial [Pseudomonas aeruginosa]